MRTDIVLTEELRKTYYVHVSKFLDPKTSLKNYWSILKSFLSNRTTPRIAPLCQQNKRNTNFKQKTELSNNFFPRQSKVIDNTSELSSLLSLSTDQHCA